MVALAAVIVRVQISRAGVVDRAHRLIGKIPRPSTDTCTLEAGSRRRQDLKLSKGCWTSSGKIPKPHFRSR